MTETETQTIRITTDHNVDRFIGLLELAGSEGDRRLYTKLLAAEANRYGVPEHRRDALLQRLAACSARIKRQALLMNDLRGKGRESRDVEKLMSNLLLIHGTLSTLVRDREPDEQPSVGP